MQTISKSEYRRMNMIITSDMPSTDERYDLEQCFITCPYCGEDTNFLYMTFYDENPDNCICPSCLDSQINTALSNAPI